MALPLPAELRIVWMTKAEAERAFDAIQAAQHMVVLTIRRIDRKRSMTDTQKLVATTPLYDQLETHKRTLELIGTAWNLGGY